DSLEAGVALARAQIEAGAHILDIGGESTRPGAQPVSVETECDRVLPLIRALRGGPAILSIDTSKAEVAAAALDAGAHLVNDVTGLGDPEMAGVVANARAALCVMHMRGEPRTMQSGEIHYDDLVGQIGSALKASAERAVSAGVPAQRILVDPGIGFGKTLEHNLELTRSLGVFARLGYPVLYGPSRKRFLGAITGREVHDRDRATAAACVAGWLYGARAFRVHDTAACTDALRVASALRPVPV
ncbi:MAG: dihydropteroate synthase, partial [Myxococcota bacterium]